MSTRLLLDAYFLARRQRADCFMLGLDRRVPRVERDRLFAARHQHDELIARIERCISRALSALAEQRA